ncbi:MAG: signal peptidase I [Agathobacter sp.]|uniref:signal peptidase I n=1 Tax=Agathobacter sp. TaxID=2021311 RepID=UPI002E7A6B66|nr:signal peptidase I [Agathobacter sp.]MEE1216638.1 signal peptidase I [Agathobacter sp.]
MKKIFSIFTSVVLLILILIIGILFVPKLFGIQPMVVVSGSMEPTYKIGSLLYVKEDTSDIEVGDAITFYRNGELVTHRVAEINKTDHTYTTKGDAVQVTDPQSVKESDILGKPVFDIPMVGYLAGLLNSTGGKVMYIMIIIIVTALMLICDIKSKS